MDYEDIIFNKEPYKIETSQIETPQIETPQIYRNLN
jgi:hypothetical protein